MQEMGYFSSCKLSSFPSFSKKDPPVSMRTF
jgi:hypothetical protein